MSCKCNSNNNLSVMQGDPLGVSLTLDNPEELAIQHVYFVCKSLNIDKEFAPSNDNTLWTLNINTDVTQNFWIGNFSFDVTAVSDVDEVFTVIHNGNLRILHKGNIHYEPQN